MQKGLQRTNRNILLQKADSSQRHHWRVKGIKHDTLSAWLREAGSQAQQVEEVLLQDYQWSASQIDALWTYVRSKERKRHLG
jgi:hypothetical protein